jgi:sRNA-binding carbon storage regulator CsrA
MSLTAGPGAASMTVVATAGAAVPVAVAAPEKEELCRKEIYSK